MSPDTAPVEPLRRHTHRSERVPPSADARTVRAGWPRPHYLGDDGRPKYVQYVGGVASEQIMHCDSDRTHHAGRLFGCSCCGLLLERGLLLDVEGHASDLFPDWLTPEHGAGEARGLTRLGRHDRAYGSPLCYRCALFAVSQCPFFGVLAEAVGDDLRWLVVTGAGDYEEFDSSTAITPVDRDSLARTVTREVREEVRAGRLHLAGGSVDDTPITRRPGGLMDSVLFAD